MERSIGHIGEAIRPHMHDTRLLDVGEEGHVVIEPGVSRSRGVDEAFAARRVTDQIFMDGV